MRRLGGCVAVLATLGAMVGTALADGLDHPAPTFAEPAPTSSDLNAGGENAEWELVTSIPTGNPHTDLTVYLHREPATEWVCLDAVTRLEPAGVGMSDTLLWDEHGRIGRGVQALLVRGRV